MFAKVRWSHLIASALIVAAATPAPADDTFVQEGVIVKPLPKWKQRQLERKLLKNPGNKVVIEGASPVTPSPDALAGVKSRRAFRPLFGDRSARRDIVVASPVGSSRTIVAAPAAVVSTPKTIVAPGDPLVLPGSVDVPTTSNAARPPIVSTPRGRTVPVEPPDELEPERPATGQILPAPAEEIPPPVVSIPRKPSTSTPVPTDPAPAPAPAPSTLPPVDPGPSPASPPPAPEPAPEPEPASAPEPTLERPLAPKPA